MLTGTEKGMSETFGTTCHGAVSTFCYKLCSSKSVQKLNFISIYQGRALSRAKSRYELYIIRGSVTRERCDLVGVKLEKVHELFQNLSHLWEKSGVS